MKNKLFILSALAILLTSFIGCSKSDTDENVTISVRLTDAPGDFDAVYIDVQDVMVKRSSDTSDNGWESIGGVTPQIYDLLTLTGGIDALLGDGEIPSGMLNQLRLVLGSENTVVINGVTMELKTPSAQQSGLKLAVNTELVPGVDYTFLLDFDVDKSVVIGGGGSGIINLKPVIRVTTEAESGAISGAVTPFDAQVAVSIVAGTETISAYTDTDGKFMLHGVPPGTYTITFTPDANSASSVTTLDDVIVVLGENNDVGTVTLN